MMLPRVLEGFIGLIEANKPIEMMQLMPQRVENGELIRFNGKKFCDLPNVDDVVILEADRLGSRFTDALWRDYKGALTDFIAGLDGKEPAAEEAPVKK